eukprot:309867_1
MATPNLNQSRNSVEFVAPIHDPKTDAAFVTSPDEKKEDSVNTRVLTNTDLLYIGGIVIGAVGVAVAGVYIYQNWFSESTLMDQNRKLVYQNQSYKTDITQLQNQIDVWKTHDLKGRDGTIQALEELNNKYLTDLKSAKGRITELELKVVGVEDIMAYKEDVNIKMNALHKVIKTMKGSLKAKAKQIATLEQNNWTYKWAYRLSFLEGMFSFFGAIRKDGVDKSSDDDTEKNRKKK